MLTQNDKHFILKAIEDNNAVLVDFMAKHFQTKEEADSRFIKLEALLNMRFKAVDNRLGVVELKLDQLENRVYRLEDVVAGISSYIHTEMEFRFHAIESRVGGLEVK